MKQSKIYTCQKCEEFYDDVKKLKNHIKLAHGLVLSDYLIEHPDEDLEKLMTGKYKEDQYDPKPVSKPGRPPSIEKPLPKIQAVYYYKELFENSKQPEKWTYFKHIKEEYLAQGYPDCEALNICCFNHVLLRDLNTKLISCHNDGVVDVDKDDIKRIEGLINSMHQSLKEMQSVLEKTRKEKSIADEIKSISEAAEDYITKNSGEFFFKCNSCGKMIDNHGFPSWAHEVIQDISGKSVYLLWNKQAWELVKGIKTIDSYGNEHNHKIPLYVMLFILETSVEGIIYTAKERDMDVREETEGGRKIVYIDGVRLDVLEEEEHFQRCYALFKKTYHNQSYRDL